MARGSLEGGGWTSTSIRGGGGDRGGEGEPLRDLPGEGGRVEGVFSSTPTLGKSDPTSNCESGVKRFEIFFILLFSFFDALTGRPYLWVAPGEEGVSLLFFLWTTFVASAYDIAAGFSSMVGQTFAFA